MAELRLLRSNFSSGELSPRLAPHGNLARYVNGLAVLENFQIHPLGGALKRSGLIWAADAPVLDAPARIVPFVRAVGQAVQVLICRGELRFLDVETRDYVRDGGGAPVVVECPWTDEDLRWLSTWQSVDVLYFADQRREDPPFALRREGDGTYVLAQLDVREGPWEPDNDTGVVLTPSGNLGVVEILASAPVFAAIDQGRLIRLKEPFSSPGYRRWEAGENVGAGEIRQSANRIYLAVSTGTTGNNAPVHLEGTVRDSQYGVAWQYLHDGAGIVRITAVWSPQRVDAEVVQRLPVPQTGPSVALTSTQSWAFGVYGPSRGWPAGGTIHQERFVLCGSAVAPDTFHAGKVGGYGPTFASFKPGTGSGFVVDSDAISREIANGQVQPLLAAVSADQLYLFTETNVHIVTGPSLEEAITPSATRVGSRSDHGLAPGTSPVRLGSSLVYASGGGRTLRELVLGGNEERELSLLSEHVVDREVRRLAVVSRPRPLLYVALADGGLAGYTVESREEVLACWRLPTDGEVLAVAPAPRPSGRDELWLVVRRFVNGSWRTQVEVLPPPWDRRTSPWELACAVDAAGFFDFWNKTSTTCTLTVLDQSFDLGRLDFSADVLTGDDVGRVFALRLAEPANGPDPGAAAAPYLVRVDGVTGPRRGNGTIVRWGADALPGEAVTRWARCATTLTGLSRLEGKTVSVFADGAPLEPVVVAGGQAPLDVPVARGWVGLPFAAVLEPMPVAEGPGTTGFGYPKKVEKVWVVARHADAGLFLDPEVEGREPEQVVWRAPDTRAGDPPTPRDGFLAALDPDGWTDNGTVRLRHASPTPCEVSGLVLRVQF